jgi:hypothetical protein
MQKPTDDGILSEDLLVAVYESLLRYWIKQQVPKEKLRIWPEKGC